MKSLLLAVTCCLAVGPRVYAEACGDLLKLQISHAKITRAAVEQGDGPIAQVSESMRDLPPFCRVSAVLTPTLDSSIQVEVWMPVEKWNGRFEGTGSGGFAGSVQYWGLADGLRRGYAVANTDMGTAPSTGGNADSLIGHPEKWTDWGRRATHEMTVAAKEIIRAYYQRPPQHSYFNGCSTGGEQGLMEAQRYPDDYDGIVSGAPAHNRTRLHMAILWNFVVSDGSPATRIPAEKLPMLESAVLNACAAEKAVPTDSFLSLDPALCHWNPQELLCKAADKTDCLTAEQVETAKKIYAGPSNPVSHTAIYPGVEFGSESGWISFVPKDGNAPYDSIFKWVFGPQWKWQSFDFNRDVATLDGRLAPNLNANSSDLGAFQAAGHKMILYHGWADWLVPPRESLNYYESVVDANAKTATVAGGSKLDETRGFFRLFMIPGMSHCSGGPGLNEVETLKPLEQWVEDGVAPVSLAARRSDNGTIIMTRPVCAYPEVARYRGEGDVRSASSFACSTQSAESGAIVR
jgi:feruloyl esterase